MAKNISNQKMILTGVVVVAIVVLVFIVSSQSTPRPAPAGNGQSPTTATTSTSTSSLPSSSLTRVPTSTVKSTVWRQYTAKKTELIVSYPPGWDLGPNTPISMDNFNHAYGGDSSIPMGGAEIDIASTTIYGTIAQHAASQLSAGKITATSTTSVSGATCQEYFYGSTYAPNVSSKNVAVYCPYKGTLYEIYLSYRANDPKGSDYLATLGEVLSRLQLTR